MRAATAKVSPGDTVTPGRPRRPQRAQVDDPPAPALQEMQSALVTLREKDARSDDLEATQGIHNDRGSTSLRT
jgi:hypothetical protein